MSTKNQRLILLAILLLSVLLRVGVALYLGDSTPPAKDETSYSTLAARLAAGHGFSFDRPWYPFTAAEAPTAHWSFLETIYLGGIYAAGGGVHPLSARLLTALLCGILMPWLTYRLARRVLGLGTSGTSRRQTGHGDQLPLVAAALAAVYPYFVLYGAMVQTEAFFICALLWSLERALAVGEALRSRSRSRSTGEPGLNLSLSLSLSLGLSLGIATLLRQSVLPWVAVVLAWLLYVGYRYRVVRMAVVVILTSTLTLSLLLVPFTARNVRAYGQFLLLNSNAGYAMYSAQHPMHGTSFQEFAAAPLPADLVSRGLNEAQWDRELMRRGIGFVLADPGRYLLLSLSRAGDYFDFLPNPDTSLLHNLGRLGSFGLFLPFMLYGIFLEVKGKAKGEDRAKDEARGPFLTSALALTLAFVIFYSLLHIFTWAMPRYRLPVDAVLLIFAAQGLVDLACRVPQVLRRAPLAAHEI